MAQMACQYPKDTGCQHPQAFRQTADTFKCSCSFVAFHSVLDRKSAQRRRLLAPAPSLHVED